MPNEPTEITILSYFDGKITGDVEAFWLWHGAEHRNDNLCAIITLYKRELQTDGIKSQ
jgi:hypothetical protein